MIRENHRFLWDDEEKEPEEWEQRLAKKYYSKLFREYCICDLTRYKDNKIAMRWRIEPEVLAGKGQFVCGSRQCPETEVLRSWEVNFTYSEGGAKKSALVKLRLCSSCSKKLNYHSVKRLAKTEKRKHVPKDPLHSSAPKRRTVASKPDTAADPEINNTVLDRDQWSENGKLMISPVIHLAYPGSLPLCSCCRREESGGRVWSVPGRSAALRWDCKPNIGAYTFYLVAFIQLESYEATPKPIVVIWVSTQSRKAATST